MKLIIFSSVFFHFYMISQPPNTSKVGCYMSNHASISSHLPCCNPIVYFIFIYFKPCRQMNITFPFQLRRTVVYYQEIFLFCD